MNRIWTVCLLVIAILVGCSHPLPPTRVDERFTDDVLIKTTPVKNQGTSSLCWLYAMLGTIESERLMMGDSVNLSVDYLARKLLEEQTQAAFFMRGKKPIQLRGVSSMTLDLIQRYGLLHEDSYPAKNVNYNVLRRKMRHLASCASSLSQLQHLMEDKLDQELGSLPRFVFFLHAEYTPLEFAHSVCLPHEYLSLTSFTHHPYGHSFVLEIPDNQFRQAFKNLPLDTLMTHLKKALQAGHPVCWEGDISEPGFSFANGVATLENAPVHVTAEMRQRAFETLKTTDDHCMVLVGMAHDRQGRVFFKAKNSWGTNSRYQGYMYLSEAYVRLKTIELYMSQAAYHQSKAR